MTTNKDFKITIKFVRFESEKERAESYDLWVKSVLCALKSKSKKNPAKKKGS